MLLRFYDETVLVGDSTGVKMTYDVIEHGDPVVVECTAVSHGGTQYLAITSSGDPATFTTDVGMVRLIPLINLVYKTRMEAYLVLDEPADTDVAFTCNVVSAASTTAARGIANNPVCNPIVFERPTRDFSDISPPSNGTNDTSTEASTTVEQTTFSATGMTLRSTTAQPFPFNGSTSWYLPVSEFEFKPGDIYQTIEVLHHSPLSFATQELVVLTCCAPYQNNANPKYINDSTALLMVVDLTEDMSINWTLSSTDPTLETEIPNTAYVELAPCACDMTAGHCDTGCCCDVDCTDSELETFSACIPGLPGGQDEERYQYTCENVNVYTSDWHPLLCIEITSTPYLGLYYDTKLGVRDIGSYRDTLADSDHDGYSYADPGRRYGQEVHPDLATEGYKQGIAVKTRYPMTSNEGFLSLPMPSSNTHDCTWMSPIRYLVDANSSCVQLPLQSLCTSSSMLSAQMYVISTNVDQPPCPTVTKVISEHGTTDAAPVTTKYYCTDDVTAFQQSDLTTREIFPRFEPSFFPDNNTDSSRIDLSQLSRCPWDDGYTYPPAPEYDFDSFICSYAVLSAQYNIRWKGTAIVLLEATYILGNITLDLDPEIEPEESPEYVPAPPDLIPTPTASLTTRDVDLNVTTPDITTDSATTSPPLPPSTVPPTTQQATTESANATETPITAPPTTKVPDVTTSGFPSFTQFFSVYYTYQNELQDENEDGVLEQAEITERSGNPGYILGKLVLTGRGIYEQPSIVENITYPVEFNCTGNSTIDPPECNETIATTMSPIGTETPEGGYIITNTSDQYRLKLWNPGAGSLCDESDYMDVYFGQDVASGCLIRLGWTQFQNCSELRYLMEQQLQQLFPGDNIGKRGNADVNVEDEWATIFNPVDNPYVPVEPSTDVPTAEPTSTLPPGKDIYYPEPISNTDEIIGTCYDIPTGINIEILTAVAGQFRGMQQLEIVSARVNYTRSTMRLNCIGPNGVSCYGEYASSYNFTDEEPVQAFLVSSTVTFISVPAVEPEAPASYYVNDTNVCKYDTCAWEAFYPMTVHNKGGYYQQNLAYGLFLILLILVCFYISKPWW
ncbi:tectonic-2-like [Saccoglossus kowalevskii]|uniref:Uncharacterized protein LOC100372782 n=1 Tax=Saccoglossus kowalevskii TaxID=10224 RepID=A0ABM0MJ09_SACKO|nr:PREDICTED: uncharacterized protein LOC100372782 [Saccoglossus kowalevskii]